MLSRLNCLPTDGSSISVYVDSELLGTLDVYNEYRVDVSTSFPGLCNSDGPVGAYILDTTAYENGVHTIYWIAVDDQSNTDGIGSRYFTIFNDGAAAQTHGIRLASLEGGLSSVHVQNMPACFEPIEIKKGFKQNAESIKIHPDIYGNHAIEIEEVERLEIDLGDVTAGYTVVGSQLRTLPIGSTLDREKGKFYWLPGPGFVGEYDLLFLIEENFGLQKKLSVRVRIHPKFST